MITLDLPMPPSVNDMWRSTGGGGRGKTRVYLSAKYVKWKADADLLVTGKLRAFKKIERNFTARIVLDRKLRRGDCDNRIKPVLDYLTRVEVIADDRYCDKVSVEWGDTVAGCLVEVVPVA